MDCSFEKIFKMVQCFEALQERINLDEIPAWEGDIDDDTPEGYWMRRVERLI